MDIRTGEKKIIMRNKFLKTRNGIPSEKRTDKSKVIMHFLDSLDCVNEADNVLVYVNYRSEVETKDYVEYLLHETTKHIFAPKVIGMDIEFYEIESISDLEEGYQKILEPKENESASIFDENTPGNTVVFVPGVVFDKKGGRMGYGKGFYDRFLCKFPNAIKIGLAFAEQIAESGLPREEHDILMDYVITDERMYFI